MQSASLGCKWSLELLFALIVFKQINAIVVFQTEWLYITKIKSAKWEETALETLIWSEFWNVLCIVKSSKQLVEKNILFSQGHVLFRSFGNSSRSKDTPCLPQFIGTAYSTHKNFSNYQRKAETEDG